MPFYSIHEHMECLVSRKASLAEVNIWLRLHGEAQAQVGARDALLGEDEKSFLFCVDETAAV